MKIFFMGTPDFAQKSLEKIYEANFDIVGVATNVDKPKGRGMKVTYTPVKEYAFSKNIEIFQPEKVRNNNEFLETLKQINPDIICVVAYGKILPKELLEIPKLGCVNLHASLLPKYRGAAPIQWAIINGDKLTGVSTIYMDEGMDTGDVILEKEVEIGEDETTGELWNRLSIVGSELLVETLKQIENGKAPRKKQKGVPVMAPMLKKEMSKINWEEMNGNNIENLCRGLNPIMGIYSDLDDKKYKFWKVKALTKEQFVSENEEFAKYEFKIKNIIPGTIIISDEKQGLYIRTVDGLLKVLTIQAENSKQMTVQDFFRGNEILAGKTFK